MGDEDRVICQNCSTSYDKKFLLGKQGNVDTCPMCGAGLKSENSIDDSDLEKSPVEKKTFYYYDDGSATLDDMLFNGRTPLYTFEAVDMEDAERQLKEVCPNSPLLNDNPSPKVQCPYCFSTEIQLVPKKFSLLTGFSTNGFNRVCVRCQRKI